MPPPAAYALRPPPEHGAPSREAAVPADGVLRRPADNCGCRFESQLPHRVIPSDIADTGKSPA